MGRKAPNFEFLRALPFLQPRTFSHPTYYFTSENFGENAPSRLILKSSELLERIPPNLKIAIRPTNPENFVRITEGIGLRHCRAFIFPTFVKFAVLGPTSHPCTNGVILGVEESIFPTPITPSVQRVELSLRGEKLQNRSPPRVIKFRRMRRGSDKR